MRRDTWDGQGATQDVQAMSRMNIYRVTNPKEEGGHTVIVAAETPTKAKTLMLTRWADEDMVTEHVGTTTHWSESSYITPWDEAGKQPNATAMLRRMISQLKETIKADESQELYRARQTVQMLEHHLRQIKHRVESWPVGFTNQLSYGQQPLYQGDIRAIELAQEALVGWGMRTYSIEEPSVWATTVADPDMNEDDIIRAVRDWGRNEMGMALFGKGFASRVHEMSEKLDAALKEAIEPFTNSGAHEELDRMEALLEPEGALIVNLGNLSADELLERAKDGPGGYPCSDEEPHPYHWWTRKFDPLGERTVELRCPGVKEPTAEELKDESESAFLSVGMNADGSVPDSMREEVEGNVPSLHSDDDAGYSHSDEMPLKGTIRPEGW